MARRRPREDDDDVSLFPFLSVIAAMIGVLTLMIASVTLGQMNQADVKEAIEHAIAMEGFRKQLASMTGEITTLQLQLERQQAELLKKSSSRQAELIKSKAELEELLSQLAAAEKKARELQNVKILIPEIPPEHREDQTDLERQIQQIKENLASLTKELEKRNNPEEAKVNVMPGGSGFHYTPRFVECTASTIVLHTTEKPLTMRAADAAKNPEFTKLLQSIAKNPDHILIFLLRSDSLSTYRAVKKLCDDQGIRNGKLPVLGNGRLDLSQFREKKS